MCGMRTTCYYPLLTLSQQNIVKCFCMRPRANETCLTFQLPTCMLYNDSWYTYYKAHFYGIIWYCINLSILFMYTCLYLASHVTLLSADPYLHSPECCTVIQITLDRRIFTCWQEVQFIPNRYIQLYLSVYTQGCQMHSWLAEKQKCFAFQFVYIMV